MTPIDRVLVPLDGSSNAEAALSWLETIPAREILLLRVCPDDAARTDEITGYLAEVAARLTAPGRMVRTSVTVGSPAEEIVGAAENADLVMMCTQGAGGGGRRVYGSVADRVSRHAPVPTLLLRSGTAPVTPAVVRRVVVPLDGSAAAEGALPTAATVARMVNAPVALITICDEPTGPVPSPEQVRNAADLLAARAQSLREDGLVATADVRSGEPAMELLKAIVPGDLIVATTHGAGTARRWQIGHVAEQLLRQAAAPILLIRADGS